MHKKDNISPPTYPEILTRKEASAFTRFSEKGFRNALRNRVFREIKVGRKRLYRKSALLEALQALEE